MKRKQNILQKYKLTKRLKIFSEEIVEPIDLDIDSEDMQSRDNITYSISHVDPLCIKFNELLGKGVVERSYILYKL